MPILKQSAADHSYLCVEYFIHCFCLFVSLSLSLSACSALSAGQKANRRANKNNKNKSFFIESYGWHHNKSSAQSLWIGNALEWCTAWLCVCVCFSSFLLEFHFTRFWSCRAYSAPAYACDSCKSATPQMRRWRRWRRRGKTEKNRKEKKYSNNNNNRNQPATS